MAVGGWGGAPHLNLLPWGEEGRMPRPRPALSPSQREGGLRRSPRGGKARGGRRGFDGRWRLGRGPSSQSSPVGRRGGTAPPGPALSPSQREGGLRRPLRGKVGVMLPPFSVVVCGAGLCYSLGAGARVTPGRTSGGMPWATPTAESTSIPTSRRNPTRGRAACPRRSGATGSPTSARAPSAMSGGSTASRRATSRPAPPSCPTASPTPTAGT